MLHHTLQIASLIRDLAFPATPNKILSGKRMFRAHINYQQAWLKHFYPDETISSSVDTWQYLQKFTMPLLQQRASSYHLDGIRKLKLDQNQRPVFDDFRELFYVQSNGFEIHPSTEEIEPREYFELISHRKFPCVQRIRSHHELFCANEPDFWHEATGHLAPLCDTRVQEFYAQCAEYILHSKDEQTFEEHMAVAWTLMEYGYIKQCGLTKMFGAALAGSHLAHMRHSQQFIAIEPAVRSAIIQSGFYLESTPVPRNHRGKFRFFCMDNLDTRALFCA